MERQPSSRSCFVCGRDNPISLKVRWVNDTEAGRVRSTVTVPAEYNSYPGVVHGGVVSALLDETAGRALMLGGDFERLMVTVRLQVTFRRPTPTGVPLELAGWVVQDGASRARAAAEVATPDGVVTATCEALLARPPAEVSARFDAEREHWKVDDI